VFFEINQVPEGDRKIDGEILKDAKEENHGGRLVQRKRGSLNICRALALTGHGEVMIDQLLASSCTVARGLDLNWEGGGHVT
jgi:hypothetical protein